jgi:hypothetical protein
VELSRRDNVIVLSSERLLTKLCRARAVEIRNGAIVHSRFSLVHHEELNLSGHERPPPKTIVSLRSILAEYDPSLAHLDYEELSAALSLLIYSFQSNVQEILAELRKVD